MKPTALRSSSGWEIDLVPLPIALDDDHDARPAAVLIVGDSLVLHSDIVSHPPAAIDAIAALLSKAIADTAARMTPADRPRRVTVRHQTLAEALRALGGALVIEHGSLPQLDHAARSLIGHLAGGEHRHAPAAASAPTWKAWGLPRDTVTDLFQSAAGFFRGRPWRTFENADLLRFDAPSGRWFVCVMGAGGEEFGIAMYERLEDIEGLFDHDTDSEAMASVTGMMLSLSFDRCDNLPPLMRKEILVAGWPVAAPDAYPMLMTLNMPGGGITTEHAADIALALRGTAQYARVVAKAGRDRTVLPGWRDAGSGARMVVQRVGEGR